ncbi:MULTISPECIES: hypothetical protein [unclassified Streptomyces]|uniref:hypothetical protein n=1 Tax=unclassified Streptomyces TaxID=2593676 RepID=UPI0033C7EC91
MNPKDYVVEGDECGYVALIHDESGETVAEGGCNCCADNEVDLGMLIEAAEFDHQNRGEHPAK